jgi:hypothetical protein
MVLYDFRLFSTKSLHFFIKTTPIPIKNPQKHKIFCKFGPKNIKIARLKKPPPPDFDVFWTEFAKYFVFLGIFDCGLGVVLMKKWRDFCPKKVENRKAPLLIAIYWRCNFAATAVDCSCCCCFVVVALNSNSNSKKSSLLSTSKKYFFNNQLSVIKYSLLVIDYKILNIEYGNLELHAAVAS